MGLCTAVTGLRSPDGTAAGPDSLGCVDGFESDDNGPHEPDLPRDEPWWLFEEPEEPTPSPTEPFAEGFDEPFAESPGEPPGALPDDFFDDHHEHPTPRRRSRLGLSLVVVIVTIALVGAYAVSQLVSGYSLSKSNRIARAVLGNEDPDPSLRRGSSTTSSTMIRGEDWPPAPTVRRTTRVAPAPRKPSATGAHSFLRLQPDGVSPVAYDPCREIHYVTTGLSRAPIGGQQMVADAIAYLSQLTGLVFVDDGPTDEVPSDDRPSYQPERYGERWAPVLVAWSDAAESPRLAEQDDNGPDTLGVAGSAAAGVNRVSDAGRGGGSASTSTTTTAPAPSDASNSSRIGTAEMIYVTGMITLDAPDFTSLLAAKDGHDLARAVLLHELAHLLGLNHVDDPTELMFPTLQPGVADFGPGDRQGLFAVGTGKCMPDI